MNFLIRSLYWTTYTTIVLCCNPGEYSVNNVCCPMCPPGQVVRVHCTDQTSSTVCIPCVAGTYMNHPNGITECLRCKDCDNGAGLQEKTKCTYTSDTECECRTGYFCTADELECDLCQQHKICEPGKFVKATGTARANTECEDCPSGHFSNKSMSATCTAWTTCPALSGEHLSGTPTSDSTCKRSRFPLLLSVLIVPAAILILIAWIKGNKEEKKIDHSQCCSSIHPPVQEQGTR